MLRQNFDDDYQQNQISPRLNKQSAFKDRKLNDDLKSSRSEILKKKESARVCMKSIEELIPYN